ncbi:hypothetical protein BDN70DRAFT_995871 [Pholiota conissans]|uniref:Uncharacterized protein n=1 Tax=Pholiota conissans TaxID=109636 RepID=A0A9P5YVE2_9AGAR|nr:hypothetical protein BDN70DRAFT_995871 [Pholiota conissans]
MDGQEWHLTILLLQGLRLMRPEKAWRPIVTVEVDAHGEGAGSRAGDLYETMLGVDGQCVNQREGMRISTDASPTSKLDIKIWHRSQSKKKKRRVLVASASACLGELQKRQEGASEGKLDIRLQCRTSEAKSPSSAARGRPQNGAVLRLKLRPPPSSSSSRPAYTSISSSSITLIASGNDAAAGPSRTSTMDTQYTDESRAELSDDTEERKPLLGDNVEISSPVGSDHEHEGWSKEITITDDTPDLISFTDDENNQETPRPQPPIQTQTLRRRRPKRVKGYTIDTDASACSTSASEDSECESLLSPSYALRDDDAQSGTFVDDSSRLGFDDSDDDLSLTPHPSHLTLSLSNQKSPHTPISLEDLDLTFHPNSPTSIDIISFSPTTTTTTNSHGVKVWIALARDMLLPQYTEKIRIPRKMSGTEKALSAFTLYADLCDAAEREKEAGDMKAFEGVMRRLQNEWGLVGGLLLALAGVNTAMFTISSDSMFKVGDYAQAAIATSSVASGLGIACTAWFFLRYNWADAPTFIARSRDLFNTHFFFALSARVPALCMFTSACALTACLALIAFATFPQGVLVLCFLVGVLMSLQFIVFGVSWVGKRVVMGGKKGGERVRGVVMRVTGKDSEEVVVQGA